MREILFRGKHDPRYGAGWCYGVPYIDHENDCIMATCNSKSVVILETVGQFTGLTDKNGVRIFEGDICHFAVFDYEGKDTQYIGTVNFGAGTFVIDTVTDIFEFNLREAVWEDDEFEIIGNKFDNPELLNGEKGGK